MPRKDGKGRGRGQAPDDPADAGQGRPDAPGRSESSPGHLKKDAGARSARDFAPGRRDDVANMLGGGSALLRRV